MPKEDPNWKLSSTAKAEILAGTIHVLASHMPKVWKKVPAWLRAQIRQAMLDCSVEHKDLTSQDRNTCLKYATWLAGKHPQPGLALTASLKKRKPLPKKPRYLHFAFIDKEPDGVGQYGCAWGTSLADVQKNSDLSEIGDLVRMPQRDCKLCKENE
jgi:hypothetical protein